MESRDWSSDVCSSDLFPSHDTHHIQVLLTHHYQQKIKQRKQITRTNLLHNYQRKTHSRKVLQAKKHAPSPLYDARKQLDDGKHIVLHQVTIQNTKHLPHQRPRRRHVLLARQLGVSLQKPRQRVHRAWVSLRHHVKPLQHPKSNNIFEQTKHTTPLS